MYSNISFRIVFGAFSALALTILFSSTAQADGPVVNMKKGVFETAQQKNAMKAFRHKGAPKTDAEVKQLGLKLFRQSRSNEAVELKDDKTGHLISVGRNDPSAHFRVNKKIGDFTFNKGMKDYLNDKETIGLPQGEKAVDIAKKHLTDLGLMPEKQEEMVVRHIGGLKQADVAAEGKSVEKDKLVTVHFGRQIDGVDVGGPGSKIVVELGTNGELVSVHRRWIELTEEKKRADEFALEADISNKINEKLKKDGAKAKQIDAESPDFGYFDDGDGNIEPAYFYLAELNYDLDDAENPGKKKEFKEKYLGVVPALKQSKAKFDQIEKAKTFPRKPKEVAIIKPSINELNRQIKPIRE